MPEDGPIIVYVFQNSASFHARSSILRKALPFFNSVSTHHNMILDPMTLCMFRSFDMSHT